MWISAQQGPPKSLDRALLTVPKMLALTTVTVAPKGRNVVSAGSLPPK